jgi:hypothetical protein
MKNHKASLHIFIQSWVFSTGVSSKGIVTTFYVDSYLHGGCGAGGRCSKQLSAGLHHTMQHHFLGE